jgi:hypothetical protein
LIKELLQGTTIGVRSVSSAYVIFVTYSLDNDFSDVSDIVPGLSDGTIVLKDIVAINNRDGRTWTSYSNFENEMGPAGWKLPNGQYSHQWHHIVEQTANKKNIDAVLLQSTNNIVRIDNDTHKLVSNYYSSKQDFSKPDTVRVWLSKQEFEDRWDFGMNRLRVEKWGYEKQDD